MPQSLHRGPTADGPPGIRRSGACGRARGGPRRPCGRPWWPCGRENRDGACARACSVDRSVSRVSLRWSRRNAGCFGWCAPARSPANSGAAGVEYRAAYKGLARFRQCDALLGPDAGGYILPHLSGIAGTAPERADDRLLRFRVDFRGRVHVRGTNLLQIPQFPVGAVTGSRPKLPLTRVADRPTLPELLEPDILRDRQRPRRRCCRDGRPRSARVR